jgi:hypothetical protein
VGNSEGSGKSLKPGALKQLLRSQAAWLVFLFGGPLTGNGDVKRALTASFRVFFDSSQHIENEFSAFGVIMDAAITAQRFANAMAELIEGQTCPNPFRGMLLPGLANPLSFVVEQVCHGCQSHAVSSYAIGCHVGLARMLSRSVAIAIQTLLERFNLARWRLLASFQEGGCCELSIRLQMR